MNPITEVMKGVTDLPIALAAFSFGLLLKKKNCRDGAVLFLLIGVSGLLGAAVHMFAMPQLLLKTVWVPLYALLYEDIRRFGLLMVAYTDGTEKKEHPMVWGVEVTLYLLTVVVVFTHLPQAIYFFVLFMAAIFIRIAASIVAHGFMPARATVLMALLLVPIVLQVLARVIPFAVVAEHLIIIVGLVIVFTIGLQMTERDLLQKG